MTHALVVDMDGTLVRTDTLHEGLLGLAATQAGALRHLPGWLRQGKAKAKAAIADHHILDPELLPYDPDVLAHIRDARAAGRPVALVSAADHRQVAAVAEHLGLFDLAVGTGAPELGEGRGNLAGANKAAFLTQQFPQGFDYIGDSAADLPVWAAAQTAYGVRIDPDLAQKARDAGAALQTISAKPSPIKPLIRACRPHQWSKNALILLPVLTALDAGALPAALLAVVCFSLTASAIYIINDLLDLPSDRRHPRKRARPFAAADASARDGLICSAGLLAIAFLLALVLLPGAFLGVLALYLVTTTAYSFWIKRKMVADVLCLATLYTLRIIAGSAATGIVLSPWLLVFSMFVFFSLATIKRQAELEDMKKRGKTSTSGRNLLVEDLPVIQGMSIASAQAAVLVFALYSQDPEIQAHATRPDLLLLICPVLFFWLGRMQILTRRGFMTDDPIVFTAKDRVSLASGALMGLMFIGAML